MKKQGRVLNENDGIAKPPIRMRNGQNKCIYLSNRANMLLEALGKKYKRSESMVLSLILEKYGPGILRNPNIYI